MTLAELLDAAADGTAALTGADGATSTLTTTAIARLWTAAADDCAQMRLSCEPAQMHVALEVPDEERPTVSLDDLLRYRIGDRLLERLCLAPGCLTKSIGKSPLTRVCRDHLDLLIPAFLPNTDNPGPGDREIAAGESRTMRLYTRDRELAEVEQRIADERARLASFWLGI